MLYNLALADGTSPFHLVAAALRTIATVKELHIGSNNLQPSDGIQLGNLLRNNMHLHTLDLRNNHLQVSDNER